MKTSELIGPALDWAVAKCECPAIHLDHFLAMHENYRYDSGTFAYSTDWSQSGPIIDRLGGFQLKIWLESIPKSRCEAHIHNYEGDWVAFGPTPLIAAMRAYVASKLGDEIEIPDELISGEISPNKEN